MGYKVLVIDDQQKICDIVKYFLENAGYEVRACIDPFEGIQTAKTFHPDVVILDIMMPGIDGYKVKEIMNSDPSLRDLPVIMLTAKSVIMNTPKEFFYGLYGFLAKPFTKSQLLKIVDEIIQATKSEEDTQFLKVIDEDKPNEENK